jgi:hypothetical protein
MATALVTATTPDPALWQAVAAMQFIQSINFDWFNRAQIFPAISL